jgi:hypothetical protein
VIKIINNKGVKKSAKEVTNGIKKLFGSLPLLNRNMEPTNKNPNNIKNNNKIVDNIIRIIKIGFIIFIPKVIPIIKPKSTNTNRLNKIVIKRPIKSSITLLDFCTFGGIEPIYKCVVKRETKTVEISPIRELREGRIKSIIGIA